MPQLKKSDALKLGLSVGETCLCEYLLLQTNISSSRETATDGIKKRKHSPTEISMELDLKDFGETPTAPPRSNVNLSQHHEIVLPQGPNHHTQHHESSQHHEIVLPQGQNRHTQHHESSQHHEIVLPQGPNHQLENTSGATPSSVWPSDNPPTNSGTPMLPAIKATLRLRILFGSCKQKLHPPHAQVWWRPIKSPASPKRLASWLWIRIQAYRDARVDLQKPSKLEPNEASSHKWIKVAPSAP